MNKYIGLSYELIAVLNIFSNFIFIQLPFLITIPIASILVNVPYEKIKLLLIKNISKKYLIIQKN